MTTLETAMLRAAEAKVTAAREAYDKAVRQEAQMKAEARATGQPLGRRYWRTRWQAEQALRAAMTVRDSLTGEA